MHEFFHSQTWVAIQLERLRSLITLMPINEFMEAQVDKLVFVYSQQLILAFI